MPTALGQKKMEYHNLNESAEKPLTLNTKQDPFYVVKGKVEKLVLQLKEDFGRWMDLLENSDTSDGGFEELTLQLKMHVKTSRVDLNDLQQTVSIVEKFRARFADITDDELNKRRRFINTMSAEVQEVETALESDRTLAKQKRDKNALFSGHREGKLDREMKREKNEKIFTVQDKAQQMEAQQDVYLDDMSAALSRLEHQGATIGSELRTHADLIQDMDDDVELALGTMDTVTKKMVKLLGTKDRGKLCCIFWLFLICVALFFLIIYT